MRVLLIHEVLPWMLKIPRSVIKDFDILTFDDALYSQYCTMMHWLSFGKRCIVFVSPKIVHEGEDQIFNIRCADAHERYFKTGDTRAYCTVEQLRDMASRGTEIGLHGYSHRHIPVSARGMLEAIQEAHKARDTLESWGFSPRTFAYPYNEINPGYKTLRDYEFFGSERVPIESLAL